MSKYHSAASLEHQKIYRAAWHQRNKVRRKQRAVELRNQFPEKRERMNAVAKEWATKNRNLTRLAQKKWRDKNKSYNAIRMGKYRVKRRSLERAASINLRQINKWVAIVRSRQVNTCYYCQNSVTLECLHFDHIVPISKGGQHSIENLCVSCKQCNQIKSATLISSWKHHPQQFLNL